MGDMGRKLWMVYGVKLPPLFLFSKNRILPSKLFKEVI